MLSFHKDQISISQLWELKKYQPNPTFISQNNTLGSRYQNALNNFMNYGKYQ